MNNAVVRCWGLSRCGQEESDYQAECDICDPELATDITNAIARAYIDMYLDASYTTSATA